MAEHEMKQRSYKDADATAQRILHRSANGTVIIRDGDVLQHRRDDAAGARAHLLHLELELGFVADLEQELHRPLAERYERIERRARFRRGDERTALAFAHEERDRGRA